MAAERRYCCLPALTALRPRIDNTMVKAIARAHRWKRLMESGRFVSVTELAEAEKINQSYLCRVLRLTLLAPDIVEAILDGRQPVELTLAVLMRPFAAEWAIVYLTKVPQDAI